MNRVLDVACNWKPYRKNAKKKMHHDAGLTLIELMVVVVILGIIAAVAIPSILGVIYRAKINTTKSTLSTLQEAMQEYASDHGGDYPVLLVQLTMQTDGEGYLSTTTDDYNPATHGGPYGPYLSGPVTTDSVPTATGAVIEKDAWGDEIDIFTATSGYDPSASSVQSTGYVIISGGGVTDGLPTSAHTMVSGELYCAGGSSSVGVSATTPIGPLTAPIVINSGPTYTYAFD